jgi:hypothetical protein
MTIEINKEKHIYTVDGVVVPSVSDILDVYFPASNFYTEEGREDGHYRHEWYSELSQGFETVNQPYVKIEPAINGFKKFMAEVKPEYVFGEKPFFHPTLKYCGTPDVVFKINTRLAVVDYKPKAKNKRTRLQTALYYPMLRANGVMVQDRYELRCYDGIYRLDKHDDLQDMRRAEIMVAAFHASQFYK